MKKDIITPNIFLRRPVLSIVISLMITLVGSLSIIALPVAQYPDLVPPTVNVTVAYPGASAETIASTALAPLEVNINGVENMLYMVSSSASGSGQGTINVYFSLGTDPTLGWSGSALQEKLASRDTGVVFGLALLMVFLVLAAQYESWFLPVSVLAAVPFGIFGALMTTWLRGLQNDVYFQIALITIIGLSAKNAILIVEFAADARRNGRSLAEAAIYAASVRFRPIIMTSIAFILGALPLAISTGAGANSRHAIGTAVIGGMLGATLLAPLYVPFFFRLIASIAEKMSFSKKTTKPAAIKMEK